MQPLKNENTKERQSYPIRLNEMIIERVQGRLDLGAKKYGDSIDVNDKRDMVEETLEEVLDAIVYSTCALIQLQHKRHEKKLNTITVNDLTLIMEGLTKIILQGKTDRDVKKVTQTQQLIDRLSEYSNKKHKQQGA